MQKAASNWPKKLPWKLIQGRIETSHKKQLELDAKAAAKKLKIHSNKRHEYLDLQVCEDTSQFWDPNEKIF